MDRRSHLELRMHGWRADVVGPRTLLREVQALYSALPNTPQASSNADVSTTIEVNVDVPRAGQRQIVRDGTPVWAGENAEALAHLEWALNTSAAEWLGERYLLFHAGSVAYAGSGLILPAASGNGKTTLVAGLVAAGFDYLSDEVAVIDTADLALLAFAKSLCIKAGGREALANLYPGLASLVPRRRFGGEPVWYLQAGIASVSQAVPVQHVVLPAYGAGFETALRQVPRSVALQHLLEQSFNLRAHGARGVGRLVELLRHADCHTLSVGSLPAAVNALLGLMRAG